MVVPPADAVTGEQMDHVSQQIDEVKGRITRLDRVARQHQEQITQLHAFVVSIQQSQPKQVSEIPKDMLETLERLQSDMQRSVTDIETLRQTKAEIQQLKMLRHIPILREQMPQKVDRTELDRITDMISMLHSELSAKVSHHELNDSLSHFRSPQPQPDYGVTGALTAMPMHCLTCNQPLSQTEPREVSVLSRSMKSQSNKMPKILYKIRPSVANQTTKTTQGYLYSYDLECN